MNPAASSTDLQALTPAATLLRQRAPQSSDGGDTDGGLMIRQIAGILRLEFARSLFNRRALAVYFLALGPVALAVIWAMSPLPRSFDGPAAASTLFSGLFVPYVRVAIFLSAVFVFMNLFRAELLEQTLHYYVLTPVRREVLVAGKYLAALLATMLVFLISTVLMYIALAMPWGVGAFFGYLFDGPGLGNLLRYLLITALACAGYGAVFLLVGQFFKNPIIPGALLWGWEAINPFLPSMLQKFSVIHYLQSLDPVPITDGLFAVVAEPTSPWLSVPGLLFFTALVLVGAGMRMRRMEIAIADGGGA
ncbi:MAG: hypothetical protein AAF772_03895 [Acidobacteriota bacterium]